jgi:AcrR family transcriptional regulator
VVTQIKTRSYRPKRAGQQEETRQPVVTAAMEPHGEVGSRHGSIKAIAECAGARRPAVYRHFSDEAQFFPACSAH